ncbi:KH domain-containing protein [Caldicellulosiruptor morganii]|uniref:RNA-binding protein KhpA n=1 Tax=Caldicellulosiruptor morganii TaxID=1387555 RepID=A0ABY7BS38_9FIRM|nr:KH domain-containing protein [Caldicellulosiruptor morganii]WAM34725.1 KH domain-containing protein [Caldicellulosiruptor morganii]
MLKDLVEVIAKSLVDNPDQVKVSEIHGEQSVIIELKVAPEDMGKVIGKQGRIARAIRTVVRAAASKENKRVIVEILQ